MARIPKDELAWVPGPQFRSYGRLSPASSTEQLPL